MPEREPFVAIDLGASSGRVALGWLDDDRVLRMELVHRFANAPVPLPDGLCTDVLALWSGVLDGLRAAAERCDGCVAGIGVDGWGVDFALLDRDGELVGNPRHYRDPRHAAGAELAAARVAPADVYAVTGIQALPFNTLNQLLALEGSAALAAAERLLLIPDLIGWWLSGEARAEETLASTTQLWDPGARAWADELIDALGVRRSLLAEPIRAGERLGGLTAAVAELTGLRAGTPVYAVAAHDTASAVAAVPAAGADHAYLASGTWSLLGLELDAPLRSAAARAADVTNEAGLDGSVRLLKNVAGLWLLQQCVATWRRAGMAIDEAGAVALAAAAGPGGPLVDPDDPAFAAPGDLPARLRAACRASGQREPRDEGELARCVLDSLAVRYREVLDALRALTGRHVDVVHVVGGGTRNELLCQLTADALELPVTAGPAEASAAGNLLVQALGAGLLADRDALRATARRSFPPRTHLPTAAVAAATHR